MPSFNHLPQEQISTIIAFPKDQKSVRSKPSKYDASEEPYGFSGYDFFKDSLGHLAIKPPFGTLTAIDLHTGDFRWQVPLGEDPALAKMGIRQSGMYNRGGSITTAGDLCSLLMSYTENNYSKMSAGLNVFFILIDNQGYGGLAWHGNPYTPP